MFVSVSVHVSASVCDRSAVMRRPPPWSSDVRSNHVTSSIKRLAK